MVEQHSFVITGASSFLGRAFAKMLCENSEYKVLLTTRSEFDFGELSKYKNVNCLPGIDLTVEDDIMRLTTEINNFLPNMFHVINCVGYFPGYATIEEIDTSTVKKVFDSNVISLYSVAHNLLPLMRERKGGHFLAFSTHTSYQNYPKMSAFTAAKTAVESLIKGIANEYLEDGISANTIALATLLTEAELKIKPKGDSKNWLRTEDVCEFVEGIILQPSKLMNGNVIHIYQHSNSYFHQSYFDRISSKI